MCHLSLSGRKSTDILSAEINTKLNQHEIITDRGEIEEVSEGGLSLQNYLPPYFLLYIQMLLMRKMPQGLQVNVNCHALLHDITDVDSKFNQTKAHAETDFVQHLIEYCTKIRGILITDLQTIEKGMQKIVSDMDDDSEISQHRELLNKTNDNTLTETKKLAAGPTQRYH